MHWRAELSARERIGVTGPSAASPRPEWLRVPGPRPGHSAGFFVFIAQAPGKQRPNSGVFALI